MVVSIHCSCFKCIFVSPERESTDDQAATLRQSEQSERSTLNVNEDQREGGDGGRDEILQLRGQIKLLRELNELKDEKIQERAVAAKVEQVELQEEGAKLARENDSLRAEVHASTKDMLRLEFEVKRLNDGELDMKPFRSQWSFSTMLICATRTP